MGYMVLILSALLVLCHGFNIKTRQLCCNLGTNYSSSEPSCKAFQPPIPGVPIEDKKACLSTIDLCCKKQLRVLQCETGKLDARKGSCSAEEGDKKDCCEACQMGIDTKKTGDPCIDTLGFGSPFTEAFISCCEEPHLKTNAVSSTTTTVNPIVEPDPLSSAEGSKYKKPSEEFALYPGLSEENVCETGEFCAQLCEPAGKTFRCGCFPGYELMKDGVSCKPVKRAKGSRCEKNNPCDHDCLDTGTAVECSCRKGYELAADKKTCRGLRAAKDKFIIIDRCKLSHCRQEKSMLNIENKKQPVILPVEVTTTCNETRRLQSIENKLEQTPTKTGQCLSKEMTIKEEEHKLHMEQSTEEHTIKLRKHKIELDILELELEKKVLA